jgi:nucleoside-diphosphate-sugar epimerase
LNAGNGLGITVGDLARMILDLMGSDATLEADEERIRPDASEVFELLADASRLRDLTGWQPEVTLREGLTHTIEWLERNLTATKPHLYTV